MKDTWFISLSLMVQRILRGYQAPIACPPIEIIDGQHRLFAFDDDEEPDGDFDVPVVLFLDLDISWQAYLFWTINITAKEDKPVDGLRSLSTAKDG